MTMLVSIAEGAGGGWAVARDDGLVSGARLLGGRHASLRALLAAGEAEAALDAARPLDPDRAPGSVRLLPTIPDPEHVLCLGLNYAAHAAETGNAAPEAPRVFLRAASSLVGHGEPVLRPRASSRLDYEGEIAVVIGRPGRAIPEERAMEHVAGYCCFMDGSIRDWQQVTTTLGKNFDRTGALGPGLVPARDVPDWRALELVTRVNGQEVQHATADRMIHGIPATLAFLSRMLELRPGDVIATGTPEGIGCRRDPPLWLRPGDRVEVEVTGLGLLSNPVADAP